MDTDTRQWLVIIVVMLIVLSIIGGIAFLVENSMEISIEKIRTKIKKSLYEEYGIKFVVDRIGMRSSNGDEFYQARIYPKKIIGTKKEGDEYYYGKASVEKKGFSLGGVADTYGEINRSLEIEKDLLPKAKSLFGSRVCLKVEQEYQKKNKHGYFVSYLNPTYKEVLKRIKKEPNQHRLLLDLELYVFDRIEDKAEKEKRRKQIFRFVQYLKEKGLFRYLEMRVVVVDERVLAPSYEKFETEIELSEKVEKRIEEEEETVHLPPMKLRKKMSKQLQQEVKRMSEEELLSNMRKIKKEDLSYEELRKWNSQYQSFIYSKGMVKEKISTSLEENKELVRGYDEISDVKIGPNLEYVYISQGGRK